MKTKKVKSVKPKSVEDIALELTKKNFNTSDPHSNPYYKGVVAGLRYVRYHL